MSFICMAAGKASTCTTPPPLSLPAPPCLLHTCLHLLALHLQIARGAQQACVIPSEESPVPPTPHTGPPHTSLVADFPARVVLPAMPLGVLIETGVSGYRRCVDLPNTPTAPNGARVHQIDCDPRNFNQLFELEHTPGNWYRVGRGWYLAMGRTSPFICTCWHGMRTEPTVSIPKCMDTQAYQVQP